MNMEATALALAFALVFTALGWIKCAFGRRLTEGDLRAERELNASLQAAEEKRSRQRMAALRKAQQVLEDQKAQRDAAALSKAA